MIDIISDISHIEVEQWRTLVAESPTATWFQTREAYDFYASLPSLMTPFVFAVVENSKLTGAIVGYITHEPNKLKQFFTRRAIIIGGPLLAADISNEALEQLLTAVTKSLRRRAIYIETRNFNDYSRWRSVFEKCGFAYQPHLNFHIDTSSEEMAQKKIGKHRWKYIRLSLRDGAKLVSAPTLQQVFEYYQILKELYVTKVKTPLFPFQFFEKLYALKSAKFLLVDFDGKIVGGTVCMSLENKALYEWFVCGDDNYHKGIRPSSVATWFGIQYAAQHGYPLFDLMGAGIPNKKYGVRDFKAEFGGNLVEHGRFIHVSHTLLYKIGVLGVKLLKF